jgi:hypothetical protein
VHDSCARRGLCTHDARGGRAHPHPNHFCLPAPHSLSPLPHSRTRRAPAPASHPRAPEEPRRRPPWSRACFTSVAIPCCIRCLGELCLNASNPGRPSVRPFPSISLCPRSLDLHHAAGVLLPSARGLTTSLPPFKGPRALSRGNQPPPAPDFPFSAIVCAQSLAEVELPYHQAILPGTATLRCFCAGVVPTDAFAMSPRSHLGPSQLPRASACLRPRLWRSSTMESGDAAGGSQGDPTQACREISSVHLRSGGLDLNRADQILTIRSGSGRSNSFPHPHPCRWARPVSPPRVTP